ncbi:hypothetical protein Daus18300_008797 [Diaporthe australafricana]|uniref:Ubiquitin-like domain-containing protein n=1 Tax=Diaporthe australafricana TaxID=127596 RepID=A0ABR3WGP0_9PEZI
MGTGAPAKAFKKKKAFAFLKSAPKPAPSLEFDDDKEADEDDDGLDLFKRSRDFFPVVVQEQEKRQATPEEKRSERPRRFSQESTQSSSPPSSKRRKLSSPSRTDHSGDSREEDLYGPPTPPRRVAESSSPSPRKSHKQSTPSPAKDKGKEKMQPVQSDVLLTPIRSNSNQPCATEVIDLDEDDDVFEEIPTAKRTIATRTSTRNNEDISTARKERTPSPRPVSIDDSDEDDVFETNAEPADDDKFAHFIQRAREREDEAKAAAAAAAAATASRLESQPSTPEGAPGNRREPVIEVKIFIQSRMARFQDLGPFGVRRGMSQNLGVIRRTFIYWLRSTGHAVSVEDEANIFLTWKRRKIYDVSTGVNLGWDPSVARDLRSSSSTPGFHKGGVLLEAWTQEDFDEWLVEEEKQRMMQRGDLVEDVPDNAPVEEDVDNRKIRISIKEKDQEPFNMTVYGDTEIRLLAPAVRKMRKIANDREIKLRYEGEWLEGEGTVEQADIEDYCTIEMYLR